MKVILRQYPTLKTNDKFMAVHLVVLALFVLSMCLDYMQYYTFSPTLSNIFTMTYMIMNLLVYLLMAAIMLRVTSKDSIAHLTLNMEERFTSKDDYLTE